MVGLGYRVMEGPGDRARLLQLHRPQPPARATRRGCSRTPSTSSPHPERPAPHPHLADAGPRDGGAAAADLHRRPRQGLPARLRRHPQPDVPPGRGPGGRRGDHARRPEGDAATSCCGRSSAPSREARLRPHFFPFTEPSVEVDVSCFQCGGSGTLAGRRALQPLQGDRAGSRSSAPAWSTPTCSASSRRTATTPSGSRASPSAWGSSGSRCCATASPTCARFFDNDVRVLEQFSMRVPVLLAARVLRPRRRGRGARRAAGDDRDRGRADRRRRRRRRPRASSSAGCSAAEQHPDADRLSVCAVDAGDGEPRRSSAAPPTSPPGRPSPWRCPARGCRAARSCARRSCAGSPPKG